MWCWPGHPAEPVLDPAGLWLDYWPKEADHPGRHQPARIGLTKKVTVGIVGDAKKVAEGILARCRPRRAMPGATSARR
jgi:thiamine pyrophosphate-dependent acetolactate synthase large subunit-like protein